MDHRAVDSGRRLSAASSELAYEIGVAEWAYQLAPGDVAPSELCELIVTALAAQGCLRHHAASGAGAVVASTTVEGLC